MKIVLSTILLILTFHCKAQNSAGAKETNDSSKEHKRLVKDSKKLKTLAYSKAIKKFGKPYETRKIEISNETLQSIFSDDLIREHFPENANNHIGSHVIEASWKMLSESWITVWYKLENNKWKPINTLTTI